MEDKTAPESIQKLINDREETRSKIGEMEKELEKIRRKELKLTQSIETGWQGYYLKLQDFIR